MKRGVWLYALCIMGGVGVGVVAGSRSDARPAAAAANTAAVDADGGRRASPGATADQRALRSRLERLEHELELLRSAAAAPGDSREPRNAPEPEPELPQKDSSVRVAEQLEVLSSALRAQPRDAVWARQTEGRVSEVLRSAEFATGNKVTQLDCRQNLCTLEVEHETAEASDWLPMQLPLALPEFGATWTTTLEKEGAARRSIFYMTRKGARLPDLRDPDERAAEASARR